MTDLYLFRNSLRDLTRPGKLTASALLIGLVLFVALVDRANAKPGAFHAAETYNNITSHLIFGFTLVILAVVFSTGVIVQEREQKTIPYLLTRPIPRWRILLVKYLAAVLVTVVCGWLTIAAVGLATYGLARIGHSPAFRDLGVLVVGAFTYSAMFLMLTTLFNNPLLFGLIYAFLCETLIPLLPGDWKNLSLMSYLHILAPHLDAASSNATDQALTSFVVPVWAAWTVLSCVFIGALLSALFIFTVREYTPREETT